MWASSATCEARVLGRQHQRHIEALRKVKPMIDTRDPRRPRSANGKGERLMEERKAQIMHENTILLGARLPPRRTRLLHPPATARYPAHNAPGVARAAASEHAAVFEQAS